MKVKILLFLAIMLVAQEGQAGTISFGGLMGDISKVAVAGQKLIHQLENQLNTALAEAEDLEPAMENLLQDLASGLEELASSLGNLMAQRAVAQPEPRDVLGSLMGDMGSALGHLANTITSLSAEMQKKAKARSISPPGSAIIGELGGLSAKAIASAAHEVAPYVKKLNAALGDLANSLTHL